MSFRYSAKDCLCKRWITFTTIQFAQDLSNRQWIIIGLALGIGGVVLPRMNLYSCMLSKSAGVVRGKKEGAAKFLRPLTARRSHASQQVAEPRKKGVAKLQG